MRRRGLPRPKRALAIYNNRTAELAEWNLEQLAADLRNGEDLSAFFLPDETDGAAGHRRGEARTDTDPDAVPEPQPTTIHAATCSRWARIGCCVATVPVATTWRGSLDGDDARR